MVARNRRVPGKEKETVLRTAGSYHAEESEPVRDVASLEGSLAMGWMDRACDKQPIRMLSHRVQWG